MPAYIIKPTKDRNFYVRWSTIVDDVTACGSRAELTEYLTKFKPYGEADPARFDRADETGTSAVPAGAFGGWDEDEFYLGQYDEERAVKRADLEAYADAVCSDGEHDDAIRHTYVLPDAEATR